MVYRGNKLVKIVLLKKNPPGKGGEETRGAADESQPLTRGA